MFLLAWCHLLRPGRTLARVVVAHRLVAGERERVAGVKSRLERERERMWVRDESRSFCFFLLFLQNLM